MTIRRQFRGLQSYRASDPSCHPRDATSFDCRHELKYIGNATAPYPRNLRSAFVEVILIAEETSLEGEDENGCRISAS